MKYVTRRKLYKKLWYQKQQAKKYGNWALYDDIEKDLDVYRIYKKHSKAYVDRIMQNRKRYHHEYYAKQGGKEYSKAYYHSHIGKERIWAKRHYLRKKKDSDWVRRRCAYMRKYMRKVYARNRYVKEEQ